MIRSIARAIAGSVSTPITGSGPSEPQAPIIASVTISGGTLVGDVLSSSISYTQVPVPSATPTYQWDRDGSPISGATSASYTLVEADAGTAITLDVSVTNSEGSDSATSNTINAAALAAPSITGVPTISGTLYEGNTLTATAASVTGNPTPATTWQWERDGTPISGATSQTYTLVSADGNTDITVVQTETNSQGSDTAESAASTIEAAPVISGVPTISGSESVGSTLTATAASVTGTPTPTRTWQWQRSADGSTGWTNISGATASTYTLVSADLNQYLRVSQIETNTSGGQTRADSAESAATGQITDLSEYAANGFDPDYVADFSATDADYFRVAGADSDFETAFTSDSEGGGLATQVDSSGNLVWRAHNYVTYSEGIGGTGWVLDQVTATANAITAPDGSLTASRIGLTVPTSQHNTYNASPAYIAGVKYSGSVYIKYDDWQYAFIKFNGLSFPGNPFVIVDLVGGSISEQSSDLDGASIESVGDGWYKVTIVDTCDLSSGTGFYLGFADSATAGWNPSFTGDGTSGIYYWGAHVYRSDLGGMADNPDPVASGLESYVPTTTAARYLARRRHHRWDGSAWVPTCLHEPVGPVTNRVDYSNDLTSGDWSINATDSLTITNNQAAGPDGNTSLAEIEITDTTNEAHTIKQDGLGSGEGFSASTDYVMSAYVRDNDQRYVSLWMLGNTDQWVNVTFDLQLGTKTQTSTGATSGTVNGADIIDLGGGLYRIWASAQVGNVGGVEQWGLMSASSGTPSLDTFGLEAYAGTAGVSYYAGFTQFEAGLLPSSYIPTNGSTVTRTADTLKGKAASLPYSSTAISMAVEGRYDTPSTGAGERLISWYAGNNDRLGMYINFSNELEAVTRSSPSNRISTVGSIAGGVGTLVSAAMRVVAASEIQAAFSGAAGSAGSNPDAMPAVSAANAFISEFGTGSLDLNGTVDTIRLWDEDIAEAGIESGSASVEIQGVPTISGTEAVGSTLTASAATVVGGPSPSTTWQWQRSANGTSGWADISGATSSTYTLVSADEDQYVRAVQTSSATAGGDTYTDSANSAASGQIVPALLLDLVAYWDLDEASGDRADSSGNGYTLTDNNTVGSAAGVGVGQTAADYVAANSEYLSQAGDAALRASGAAAWSVCGWIYVDALSGFPMVFECLRVPGSGFQLGIATDSNKARCLLGSGSGTVSALDSTTLVTGTWYFLYGQWDGSDIGVSLNGGTLVTASAPTFDAGTNPVRVGGNGALADLFLDGRVQAVGRWNRVLTSAEIAFLYNSGTAARLYADLPGYSP